MSPRPDRPWHESVDPALLDRLRRPPGVIGGQVARRILGWAGYFAGRARPFVEMANRLGKTGALRTSDVPLVHAHWMHPVITTEPAASPPPALLVVRAAISAPSGSSVAPAEPRPARPASVEGARAGALPRASAPSSPLQVQRLPQSASSDAPSARTVPRGAPLDAGAGGGSLPRATPLPGSLEPEAPAARRRGPVDAGVITYVALPARRVVRGDAPPPPQAAASAKEPAGPPAKAEPRSPAEGPTRDGRPSLARDARPSHLHEPAPAVRAGAASYSSYPELPTVREVRPAAAAPLRPAADTAALAVPAPRGGALAVVRPAPPRQDTSDTAPAAPPAGLLQGSVVPVVAARPPMGPIGSASVPPSLPRVAALSSGPPARDVGAALPPSPLPHATSPAPGDVRRGAPQSASARPGRAEGPFPGPFGPAVGRSARRGLGDMAAPEEPPAAALGARSTRGSSGGDRPAPPLRGAELTALVETVERRILRNLAIERERRGGQR